MAAAGYAAIRDAVEAILKGDARTNAARIYVEEEPQFGLADAGKVIAVFTDRRRAPADEQHLGAGKRTEFLLDLLFVVANMDMASFRAAADGRDTLLGNLELVLMANRTLSSTVSTLWLEGGEFYSAKDAQSGSLIAVAEVSVVVKVSAINT